MDTERFSRIHRHDAGRMSRRRLLAGAAGIGAGLLAGPYSPIGRAAAADKALEPYLSANIDWQQAKGQTINVAVIPASYFDVLIAATREFEDLTGINVKYTKIPPGQIRDKVVLDLSSRTGTIHTHAADPMYYPLYVANKWVEPLEKYIEDPKLTDQKWFAYDDFVPRWRDTATVARHPYGLAYNGEVTIQIYRQDLYGQHHLKPAQTLTEFAGNARALTNPSSHVWGAALRGFRGAGQNMYIWPSLFMEFGGRWFDASGRPTVNDKAGLDALTYYVDLLRKYAPPGVENWNWPDIADAFAQGSVAVYIDSNSSVLVVADPAKSRVAQSVGFARWPKGPTGRRVTSLWTWSFPINAAVSPKEKVATWFFIQWATCEATQRRTSYEFPGGRGRPDVTRTSILRSAAYRKFVAKYGPNWISVVLDSLNYDSDLGWRPLVPQWPAIGDVMATAIQSAVVGEATPKAALDRANARVADIMRRHR